MRIGFIGAGKVGFSLGKFFSLGGIQVTGYFSRHQESAREAALFTCTRSYDTLFELVCDSDAIFITVPDGIIKSVCEALAELPVSDKIFCHCSGAMTASEAFPNAEKLGAYVYSVHPLFPISSRLESYRELAGAFFCLEGSGPHLKALSDMLEALGANVRIISAQNKALYHAACSLASNFVCALADMSVNMLVKCGFTECSAQKALAPLMKSNMEHIINEGATGALTGPVERCDTETVAKHIACFDSDNEKEIYRLLSLVLLDMARRKKPERDYSTLEEQLKGGQKNA